MNILYCPDCSNYLMGGDGECHDCHCGYKQPINSTCNDDYIRGYNNAIDDIKSKINLFCKNIAHIETCHRGDKGFLFVFKRSDEQCATFLKDNLVGGMIND